MIEEKMTTPSPISGDNDVSLRPSRFEEFIGQPKIAEKLKVYVKAAKMRGIALDHTLLYGPPGLGKTTLAHIIASEIGVNIKATAAPVFEKQGDLLALLTSLEEGDVLFIDEIHRLRRTLEEVLYSAMEDFKVDIVIGEGTGAKTLRISIPRFTLVAATTRAGAITAPLRSRFGIIERLEFYPPEELQKIVTRSAKILGVGLSEDGAFEVARRSRGTPRIANRLLKRVSDFALVDNLSEIDSQFADSVMNRLDVDKCGLDAMDRKLLDILISHYGGGPAGLGALSAAMNEESETIEDVFEPFMIQQGFIRRTQRGRAATVKAYEHLGIDAPSCEAENSLFD